MKFGLRLGLGLGCTKEWKTNRSYCQSPHKHWTDKNVSVCVFVYSIATTHTQWTLELDVISASCQLLSVTPLVCGWYWEQGTCTGWWVYKKKTQNTCTSVLKATFQGKRWLFLLMHHIYYHMLCLQCPHRPLSILVLLSDLAKKHKTLGMLSPLCPDLCCTNCKASFLFLWCWV